MGSRRRLWGLCLAAAAVIAVVAVSHRRSAESELVSIRSITSAKDSLTEAAASGNPGTLKAAIESAEGLLQGLKEARGRVNELKSSLKHDAARVKSAEGGLPHMGADISDVDAMLDREKAKLQGSIEETDDSGGIGTAEVGGGQGGVGGGVGIDGTQGGYQGEEDSTPANVPSAGDDPAVARLKEELMRQKVKYMQAQRAFQAKEESEAEARARANGRKEQEEREIEREIQHYKDARLEIDNALSSSRGGSGSAAGGSSSSLSSSSSSSLGSRGLDSAMEGGIAGVGNRAVGVAAHPHAAASSSTAVKGPGVLASSAKGHNERGREAAPGAGGGGGDGGDTGGIVGAFDNALGDSVEVAKDVGKGEKGKNGGVKAKTLPGVVTDSWWTAPPKETRQELQAKEAAKEAKKAKRRDCHDLYACVGSFFSSGAGSAGKGDDVLHLDEKLQHGKVAAAQATRGHGAGKKSAGGDKDAGDNMVLTSSVEQNPQEPLLSALMPSKETHTSKLPGVAENRWGGAKFWSRLLGMPASQAKHNEHRRRMKLSH